MPQIQRQLIVLACGRVLGEYILGHGIRMLGQKTHVPVPIRYLTI